MSFNDFERSVTSIGHRRVLMVAAAFPPTGGPGVQRTVKFATYLPQLGWHPTVWTLQAMADLPQDPTLLADLPEEVRVHRQGDGSVSRSVRRMLRGATEGRGFLSRCAEAVDWRLAARFGRGDAVDDCVSWARGSVGPLCRLIQSEGIEVIYSTFSPVSNHLLALAVKQKTNLPWVADFRDLWTDDYRYRETDRKRRIAHRRMEQDILESADNVIGVTERQTRTLAAHVPSRRHKFVTITNGFDPADFPEAPPHAGSNDRIFVLAHVGRFDRWRTPGVWFKGLRQFVETLGDKRNRFELRIVGHADAGTRAKLEATGVDCTFTGYVYHEQAIGEMRSADALLLSVPDGPNADSVVPAKLFEYLAARRPVLVVGPVDGEAERIVRSCEAGVTVNFDAEDVADALAQLVIAWHVGLPTGGCSPERLARFSRPHLTRKLASVLNRITGSSDAADEPPAVPVEVGTA